MTMEERLKAQLGELLFANTVLVTRAEAAELRVAQLEAAAVEKAEGQKTK